MMIALLAIMVVLAINSIMMDGAAEGLKFYLIPDFERMKELGIGYTLSLIHIYPQAHSATILIMCPHRFRML